MSYFAQFEDTGASGIRKQKSYLYISLYKRYYGLTFKELKTHLLLFIIHNQMLSHTNDIYFCYMNSANITQIMKEVLQHMDVHQLPVTHFT